MEKRQLPPALSVRSAMGPTLGAEVVIPYAPRVETKNREERVLLSNPVESVRPVIVKPIGGAHRIGDASVQARLSPMLGQIATPVPLMGQEREENSGSYQVNNPLGQNLPLSTPINPVGGPSAFAQNRIPFKGLGQQQASQQPSAPACPGAIEMPDGRVIEPEDAVALRDLCEIIPLLLKSLGGGGQGAQGLAPGQQVPVVGAPDGVQAVPTAASFGPAAGPAGQGALARGGGGFVGGGGGAPGATGKAGVRGPAGPEGPPGPGSILETPVVKTDGDFVAGPGAFVPVPGTSLSFTVSAAGVAIFYVTATLGRTTGASGESQSAQIGVRIDGTDHPVLTRLLHTFAGGVGEFMIGQTVAFPFVLGVGIHTAEVVLRGLAPGEFSGTAIGTPGAVAATPDVPLVFTVAHN